MGLTNKQQFMIASMVNGDPSFIPEDESEEEKEFRESLISEADRREKNTGIRPIFEIPIDPWEDDKDAIS